MYLTTPNISMSYAQRNITITVSNPNALGTTYIWVQLTGTETGASTVTLYETDKSTSQKEYSLNIDTSNFFDIETFIVNCEAYVQYSDTLNTTTVAELCENVKNRRYSPVSVMQRNSPIAFLKAFCNFPGQGFKDVYIYWEYSTDGASWSEYPFYTEGASSSSSNILSPTVPSVKATVMNETYDYNGDIVSDTSTYVLRTMFKLTGNSPLDLVSERPDVICIPPLKNSSIDNTLYRATLVTVRKTNTGEDAHLSGATHTVDLILSRSMYTPVLSTQAEILFSDIYNVSESLSAYDGNTLYSYGNPIFKNNLIATHVGETVRPVSKMTALQVPENNYITAVIPWKNFIVCFTASSSHLVSKHSDGFTTSTINTVVGVPFEDRNCCKAILNGIIVKSKSKIYLIYPNLYAGTDNFLNFTELSKPVETFLEEYETYNSPELPFAIATNSEYLLMLPKTDCTLCLKYSYNDKHWTVHEYPVVLCSYTVLNVDEIKMLGYVLNDDGSKSYQEYYLDTFYADVQPSDGTLLPYADLLYPVDNVYEAPQLLLELKYLRPISFLLDSGQKSDTLNNTKQFVESKFNLATLHEKDCFPMTVTVHIDGAPFVTVKNVNTDAAFWKTSDSHTGVLNTSFTNDNSDIFNVFRQMFIRYSGKGKSIRHIIEGTSMYPFKIYEIDYRYKNLNIKQ